MIANMIEPVLDIIIEPIMETPKRKAGRPLGRLNTIRPPIRIKKAIGRPLIFGTQNEDGTINSNHMTTYERRGRLISTIHGLKRNYGLTFPTSEEYYHQPNEVVVELIKKMHIEVQNIRLANKMNKMTPHTI